MTTEVVHPKLDPSRKESSSSIPLVKYKVHDFHDTYLPPCDEKRVGIILIRKNAVAIEYRTSEPQEFSIPIEHKEPGERKKETVIRGLKEETGQNIKKKEMEKIMKKRIREDCRRGGERHQTTIYIAKTKEKKLAKNHESETLVWVKPKKLKKLAKRTEKHNEGKYTEKEWRKKPGLTKTSYLALKEANLI